jgi:hypothetical protein
MMLLEKAEKAVRVFPTELYSTEFVTAGRVRRRDTAKTTAELEKMHESDFSSSDEEGLQRFYFVQDQLAAERAIDRESRLWVARQSYLPPVLPSNAAPWFRTFFEDFAKSPLGEPWIKLLNLWARIEEAHGWVNDKQGLTASRRPRQLDTYIANGRKKKPILKATVTYSGAWWEWWIACQPSWRRFKKGESPPRNAYGNDWSSLEFPGQNGILSVVATLEWWGFTVVGKETTDEYARWKDAIDDVLWMLEGFVQYLEKQNV